MDWQNYNNLSTSADIDVSFSAQEAGILLTLLGAIDQPEVWNLEQDQETWFDVSNAVESAKSKLGGG